MTHDELLAKINALEETIHRELSNTLILGSATPFQALRAVVELHKESTEWKDIPVGICLEDGERYPCPTIQAIEKELS
jgi:hypothetical protein